MYTPKAFQVDDVELIHSFMRDNSFATIVSAHDGRPVAMHLPFMIEPHVGRFGTPIAHLARANQSSLVPGSFDACQAPLTHARLL
jgi:transcriptional regulator